VTADQSCFRADGAHRAPLQLMESDFIIFASERL
jgi:hypothetical protein